MTDYTKNLKKKRNLFAFLNLFIMFAVAITFIIIAISRGWSGGTGELEKKIGTIAFSMGVTLIILTVLLIIIGHKIRTAIWMCCLVVGAYLFGTEGMWIVLAIWLVDEYVFYTLWKHYSNKLTINKEIDKRG